MGQNGQDAVEVVRKTPGSLFEPPGRDQADEETSVFVIMDDGQLVEADEYLLAGPGGIMKQGAPAPRAQSQQVQDTMRALKYATPRVSMADLLLFYDFNVWHRRCVILKAILTAGLGFQVMEGERVVYDPRKDRRVPDHPAARFVAAPNENVMETFEELIFRFMIDYGSMGNGYFEFARNRIGGIGAMYHIPGRTMYRDARFRGYWQVKQMREHFFVPFARESRGQQRNEVLHLYQYDPVDDYYGLPDWFASFMAQGLDRTIMEYNVRLFANSLMAHLAIVVTGGRLSKNGRDAVKQFVQERMLGVKNAGRVLLMEDENDRVEIKFEKLNLDVKDLMTTKPFEFFRDVTVASHGVPPRMLGIVAAGSLGGTGEMENQLRAFRETVLRPNKLRMEKVMRLVLDQIAPGSWIRFREMDTTDLRADSTFFDKMLEHGVYKPEEVRAIVADFLA